MKTIENLNRSEPGWLAELQLGFSRCGDRTRLTQRMHRGPLTVQRPFYPEQDVCHVYVLHPPGGIVGGDRLQIDIDVGKKARALLTTPGAGKFYRSDFLHAHQVVTMQVEDQAVLEWLPQETIIYQGARVMSHVNLGLTNNAGFIGWEILAFGRPAAAEGFDHGEALLNWCITHNKKPLYIEKMLFDTAAYKARWGLHTASVCGTMFVHPATGTHLQTIRDHIGHTPQRGVTLLDNLLICRASADKTGVVRSFFENVRGLLREDIVHNRDYRPRIWAT